MFSLPVEINYLQAYIHHLQTYPDKLSTIKYIQPLHLCGVFSLYSVLIKYIVYFIYQNIYHTYSTCTEVGELSGSVGQFILS